MFAGRFGLFGLGLGLFLQFRPKHLNIAAYYTLIKNSQVIAMWLHVYDDTVIVDTDMYIQSQPVNFEQVRDVIESIAQPVNAYIDVSRVDLTQVDIIGLVKIIWTLHEHTRDQQNLLNKMYFIGASSFVRTAWYAVQCVLPTFVRQCIIFKTLSNK